MRTKKVPLSLERPTEASLLAEARWLGNRVLQFNAHAGDLVAEAGEQLRARADAPELQARGYLVSDAHFERVKLLSSMLTPLGSRRSQLQVDRDHVLEQVERARVRLLALRARFAGIGAAVGHPPSIFSLGSRSTMRVNVVTLGMEEVISNIERLGDQMPDLATVSALLIEARALVAGTRALCLHSSALRLELAANIKLTSQVSRLLYEAVMHLSAQGLAAFGDDLKRRAPYSLTHLQANRLNQRFEK